MPRDKVLGKVLQRVRKASALSPAELTDSISDATGPQRGRLVHDIEAGRKNISLSMLVRWATACGTPITWQHDGGPITVGPVKK